MTIADPNSQFKFREYLSKAVYSALFFSLAFIGGAAYCLSFFFELNLTYLILFFVIVICTLAEAFLSDKKGMPKYLRPAFFILLLALSSYGVACFFSELPKLEN